MKRSIIIFLYTFFISIPVTVHCEGFPSIDLHPAKVDFFTSMEWDQKSNRQDKKKLFLNDQAGLKKLRLLENLYNKNMFTERAQRSAVIPKIIHQIWVGPKAPPAIFKESQESIKKYHPDWEYKLWTDADIPEFGMYNQKFYDLSKNYGAKADILRYEILYRHGGVYLDVDFVCLKSLDVLLQYDLWGAAQPLRFEGAICNGVIGSIPGHPILQECITSLEESWYAHKNRETLKHAVISMVGPHHFERCFLKFIHDKSMNIIIFPKSFFFPIDYKDKRIGLKAQRTNDYQKINSFIKPEAFAIHYWAGSWRPKKKGHKNLD